MAERPSKVIRLNFWKKDPALSAYISLLGNPSEVRIGAAPKTFISVKEEGISLSPGLGKHVNIQALPGNLHYAGMLSDLPFPLSIIPVTPFTPFPKQVVVPPFKEMISTIREISTVAKMFVGL